MFSICECFKTEMSSSCTMMVRKGPQIVRCKRIATHKRDGIWICDFHRLYTNVSRTSLDESKSELSDGYETPVRLKPFS
jgi:hypothetical protein